MKRYSRCRKAQPLQDDTVRIRDARHQSRHGEGKRSFISVRVDRTYCVIITATARYTPSRAQIVGSEAEQRKIGRVRIRLCRNGKRNTQRIDCRAIRKRLYSFLNSKIKELEFALRIVV